jgi:hypothetical protein
MPITATKRTFVAAAALAAAGPFGSLSSFDTDLTSIANADYTFATGDLQGYLTDLTNNLGSLDLGSSDLLSGLLGDLTGGTAGDGLSLLTGDLGTLLADRGSALF